jgi:hypothetical protein
MEEFEEFKEFQEFKQDLLWSTPSDRRGAAFRVPLLETIYSARGVRRPNRAVGCGSLERVPGPQTWNLPWRDTVFEASRLWVHEIPWSQFVIGNVPQRRRPNATPLRQRCWYIAACYS